MDADALTGSQRNELLDKWREQLRDIAANADAIHTEFMQDMLKITESAADQDDRTFLAQAVGEGDQDSPLLAMSNTERTLARFTNALKATRIAFSKSHVYGIRLEETAAHWQEGGAPPPAPPRLHPG